MSEKARTQITLAVISGLVSIVVAIVGTYAALRSAGSQISSLNQRAEDLRTSIDYITPPPGTIVAYGGPLNVDQLKRQGWLLCNGDPVSREEFKSLYDQVGNSWGRGDGVHTFNLPDLRGVFLRGVNYGQTNVVATDPEAGSRVSLIIGGNAGNQVGSYQADNLQAHSHKWGEYISEGSLVHLRSWNSKSQPVKALIDGASSQIPSGGGKDDDYMDAAQEKGGFWTEPASQVGVPGTETRPKNAYVNYIIKY
jgi:phage-related tail fiber protein